MSLTRVNKSCLTHLCTVFLAIQLVWPCVVASQIVPPRDITVVGNQPLPQWKLLWDMGREAVRNKDLKGGARYYELVLRDKPEIEVARWEYCQILVALGRYRQAADMLERLIETSPDREDYQVLAGSTALARSEYNRAVRHLGQVYSHQRQGAQDIVVMQGLIKALLGLERREEAYLLMTQLQPRTPDDSRLLLELARMARELNHNDQAERYYTMLIDEQRGGRQAMDEAARLYVAQGKDAQAAPLWQRLLKDDPDNSEYHRQLLFHYRKTAEGQEALPHLLALLREGERDNPGMLLETARIYRSSQKRPDQALAYYERYLTLRPNDRKVAKELDATRHQVASGLLAIGGSDDAGRLWQNLDKITSDRAVIFRYMATEMERQGKTGPLLEILTILYQQPGEKTDALSLKLADLYLTAGRPEQALAIYDTIGEKRYLTASFYQRKGKLEASLGYDVAALTSLTTGLALQPDSNRLRIACIELAGRLGFVKRVQALSRPILAAERLEPADLPLYEATLEAERLNGQFALASTMRDRLLATSWLPGSSRQKLYLAHAEDFNAMGRPLAAQQLVRMLLVEETDVSPAVVGQLMEYAIAQGQLKDAQTLLAYYTVRPTAADWKTRYRQGDRTLFLASIHLQVAQGQGQAALHALDEYLAGYRRTASRADAGEAILALELEEARLAIAQGDRALCLEMVHRYERDGMVPPEMRLVKYIASGDGSINPEALIANIAGRETATGGIEQLLALARASQVLQKNGAAEVFLDEVLQLYPQSLRARLARAEVRVKDFRLEAAVGDYRQLYLENQDEEWLFDEYLRLEFRQGRYHTVLSALAEQPPGDLSIERQLLKSRALYATNNHKASFALYEKILQPTALSQFHKRLAARKLAIPRQEQESPTAFWAMFRYDEPDSLDMLTRLSGAEGFLANRHTPAGAVAADLYEQYRWQETIGHEYLARKALEENQYRIAEKQYSREIDQAQSTEGLKDLARIYERLGEYNKQAKVYSYLEKRGERPPELEESIRRNRIARAPIVSLDAEYRAKHGREGQVNLKKNSVGGTFQYYPSMNSSFNVGFAELFYAPHHGKGKHIDGRSLSASGSYTFNDKTSVEFGSGLEVLDGSSDSTVDYSIRLNRKLDQLFSGYVEYDRVRIDDTLEAVHRGLTYNGFVAGLAVDSTSGFNLGVEYQRRWYEGENRESRVYLWSSYAIYDELTTYEITGSYEQFDNSEDDTRTIDAGAHQVTRQVLPYWSPENYSRQTVSLRVHRLFQLEEGQERPPSSVSADLAVGHESTGDILVAGEADIFLEIGGNFLVKGNLFYTESGDYREKSAAISLMYRW
ncbi:MAG: tetratricopeptide repeat protein [Desulfopila sp.]